MYQIQFKLRGKVMQIDAGEFIGKLRDRLAVKLTDDEQVMAAFDRSCVEVLVEEHKEQPKELTRGQKAAATRARNKAEKAKQAANGSGSLVAGALAEAGK